MDGLALFGLKVHIVGYDPAVPAEAPELPVGRPTVENYYGGNFHLGRRTFERLLQTRTYIDLQGSREVSLTQPDRLILCIHEEYAFLVLHIQDFSSTDEEGEPLPTYKFLVLPVTRFLLELDRVIERMTYGRRSLGLALGHLFFHLEAEVQVLGTDIAGVVRALNWDLQGSKKPPQEDRPYFVLSDREGDEVEPLI